MRNEQVDWAYGEADYQPLPFAGAYKYARDFLVLGPFADENSVPGDPILAQTYRLDHDFIYDATGGRVRRALDGRAEAHARRRSGRPHVAAQPIRRRQRGFTTVFPTNNTYCTFYAHLWVYSPIQQEVGMRVGSDDSVKVIVNGAESGAIS